MCTTQPIKNPKELEALKNFYLTQQPNLRNYAMINTGLNTALRIGDLLSLKWKDVYCFETGSYRTHLVIQEEKTGKENSIAINSSLRHGLTIYRKSLTHVLPEQLIFPGRNPEEPLSRSQAFRIIKHACTELHLSERYSCHSLRKTFGYHAWSSGANPAVLTILYNHSSFQVTKRYLGIDQDDKDQLFLKINL